MKLTETMFSLNTMTYIQLDKLYKNETVLRQTEYSRMHKGIVAHKVLKMR